MRTADLHLHCRPDTSLSSDITSVHIDIIVSLSKLKRDLLKVAPLTPEAIHLLLLQSSTPDSLVRVNFRVFDNVDGRPHEVRERDLTGHV